MVGVLQQKYDVSKTVQFSLKQDTVCFFYENFLIEHQKNILVFI